MLLLYGAANLAGFCTSSGGVVKDLEVGDPFEGNTTEPKDVCRQALSQSSKGCRFFLTILIVISGLNLCASNDRLSTTLAKLTCFISLMLASVIAVAKWRVGNMSTASIPITASGSSSSHLVSNANSVLLVAFSGVTVIIFASHVRKNLLFPGIGLSSHQQPSTDVALSKHPFGLEREMAKSASMTLKAHEQRLAALVGTSGIDTEADQGEESESNESREISKSVNSLREKATEKTKNILDAAGDAPPDAARSIYASPHQAHDQRDMSTSYSLHADDVDARMNSTGKGPHSTQTSGHLGLPSAPWHQEPSSSANNRNNETSTNSHGTTVERETSNPPELSVHAPVLSSKPDDNSNLKEYEKEVRPEKK